MADDARPRRILVTNDDGIHAPGLQALERIALSLSDDVWVVAPEVNHSGAGHSLTLRRPLRVRRLDERRYAIDGTPTDCVLLALQHVMPEGGADLVLSGVNHGGNLGEDITYSGTVAAAMEATLLDVPAIALSQCADPRRATRWATSEHHLPGLVRGLAERGWRKGVLININLPDCEAGEVRGVRVVRQGKSKLGDQLVERIDPRGEPYVWIGGLKSDDSHGLDTDRGAARAGYIAVTPIHLDMTAHEELERFSSELNVDLH